MELKIKPSSQKLYGGIIFQANTLSPLLVGKTLTALRNDEDVFSDIATGSTKVYVDGAEVTNLIEAWETFEGHKLHTVTKIKDKVDDNKSWKQRCHTANFTENEGVDVQVLQFPYDVELLAATLYTFSNNDGDNILIAMTYQQIFGTISRAVASGDDWIYVSKDVYSIIRISDFMKLDDGTNTYENECCAKSIEQFAIVGVNQGSKQFQVDGDQTSYFKSGDLPIMEGSTGNDRSYTLASDATFSEGKTTVTVTQTIDDDTVDGFLNYYKLKTGGCKINGVAPALVSNSFAVATPTNVKVTMPLGQSTDLNNKGTCIIGEKDYPIGYTAFGVEILPANTPLYFVYDKIGNDDKKLVLSAPCFI
jgi:hypothetical protein